jgi:hypothetical protein
VSVFSTVYGDFRLPTLASPLANFPAPSLKGLVDTTQEYFTKVTFYEIWQTPVLAGSVITTLDEIVESTILVMYFESYILYKRERLTIEKLDKLQIYRCSECYWVKNADIIAATNLTEANLTDVTRFTVREVHEFSVKAMEKKFHFKMADLEQKKMRLSLELITWEDWSKFFVPEIVSATINFHSNLLNVSVVELGELLNKNTSTMLGFKLNEIESIFLPEFEDLI